MTRINTNVPSLVAQNRLNHSNNDLQTALTRLSTGLRINSGADDPAGLIASEALRSEITSLGKALINTRRASQIISTADSALGEVSSLLNDIRGLVVEAANSGALSPEEIAANQLQIDSSLEAINRISQTTTFQGRKLLDGSLDFVSTARTVTTLRDAKLDQANLGATGQIDVEVVISQAATQASIVAGTSAFTGPAAATATAANVSAAVQTINGENINITGGTAFDTIIIDDQVAHGAGVASYNAATGELTIGADFTNSNEDTTVIETAINAISGFYATGATGLGASAGAAPPAGAVTVDTTALTVAAVNNGAEYNDVAIDFVAGTAATAGADYDSEQKVLTVTYDAAADPGVLATDLATLIDAHTVDGAAPAAALFDATGLAGAAYDPAGTIASLDTLKTGGEVLNADLVFQLNGVDGAETFNFGSGTSASQIEAAVNLVSDSTGVTASFAAATGLTFTSIAYGSDAIVNIDVINEGTGGTFNDNLSESDKRDEGSDIVATVNGIEAAGAANVLSINTSTLDLTLTVDDGSSSNFSFSITGGGALFQLGPDVTTNQQARLGIASVGTGKLGGPTGRLYELSSGQSRSLLNDVNGAAQIIDEVIDKVTSLRGRLGAFQSTTLDSNLVSLGETQANLLEAESSIRDADFAKETASLTRAQILVQSGTNVLALANQNPQNVLSLLR